jgi:hypothetical protein
VAAGPRGAALVAWEARDGIRVAVRRAAGRRWVVRRVAVSTGSPINGVQAAHDPRGGWVLAERQFPGPGGLPRQYRVRTLSLWADGAPAGAPQDLGLGHFGLDARQVGALSVDATGVATLAFQREVDGFSGAPRERPILVTQRVHAGRFGPTHELKGDARSFADARVAPAPGGGAFVAATGVGRCGDTGCFGTPVLARLTGSSLSAASSPEPAQDNRASGAWPVATGTGAALVFSAKDRPAPFSRLAPVHAAAVRADGSMGEVQRLTGAAVASEPTAKPLSRGRALAVWTGARGWGAAVADVHGRFGAVRPPAGPPPSFGHTNPTNRHLATAGSYAIVAWSLGGRVRLTTRAF